MMKQALKYSLFGGAIAVAVATGVMIADETMARDGHFRTDVLLAQAQEAGPAGGHIDGQRGMQRAHFRGRGGRGGHRGAQLFDAFDSNNDGKVTQAEVDATRKGKFDEFDANKDGKLTLAEYEELWLSAMRDRMVDRFQFHDDDGDASVTLDEFQSRSSRMVMRLDENGDGEVTRQELRDRFKGRKGKRRGDRGDRGDR